MDGQLYYTHIVYRLFLGNNMFYIFAYIIDILIKAGLPILRSLTGLWLGTMSTVS